MLPEYPIIDVEDYLFLDRNSKNASYEYLDGELAMRTGRSTYHSRITVNLVSVIWNSLQDETYNIYGADVRLKLSESHYVHPDVTVGCDPRDKEQDDMIYYPCFVAEVLSPSTENVDRGEKLLYYQKCPSIQEYAMPDSLSIRIDVYHRERDGWLFRTYGPGSIVKLESVGAEFPIEIIYRGMNLTGERRKK